MFPIRFRAYLTVTAFLMALPISGNEVWWPGIPDAVMDDDDRARVEAGAAVVEVLPAHGEELAVFGVARVGIDSRRLIEWMRRVEDLQRGNYIPLARRFSNPPVLNDVRDLSLDDQDLDDLRECRPGDCGLKLSAAEMAEITHVISSAGPAWKEATRTSFRHMMVNRARAYLASGHAGAAPYADHETPVSPQDHFDALCRNMRLDLVAPAALGSYLRAYPRVTRAGVESFLYWSKETLGGSKPIVAITHVTVLPPAGYRDADRSSVDSANEAMTVAFAQVYASHYLTASLSLTSLTPAVSGAPRLLVYRRRSRADVLGGPLDGVVRRLIERRIRSEAPGALDGLRRRLETEPPREEPVS